ncbi:hypothetical protein KKH23_00520 [Patescibacteria group bacterium]|nr:hypothetical protein [Patescibacteria group bacterium]MBU0776959.1 hypothetical protein [Patescibacteria group bacterium]MBU0845677.1 hypothetical protein [Patescibacteria group bacterium]MBU0922988.1 hypothetical protein [Patescibacteria group bacterium]MBU1066921.1 hypothetical protein [Patescibacteria group bacterium]
MSAEMKFNGIPEKFQPLFTGSARDVLFFANNMISAASEDEQIILLEDDIFCGAVSSALHNLDQRSPEARVEITASFHKRVQPFAFKTFIGRSN